MLYTRKGDDGKTKTFGCDQRMSKSSAIAEALGSVDEINSFLGICKIKAQETGLAVPTLDHRSIGEIVHFAQNKLFTVQAELAGAPKTVKEESVKELEKMTDAMEAEMPPIKSFSVAGGSELSAHFDFARAITRRAERRVVQVIEESDRQISPHARQFMNRLSSLMYALARYSAFRAGTGVEPPVYEE